MRWVPLLRPQRPGAFAFVRAQTRIVSGKLLCYRCSSSETAQIGKNDSFLNIDMGQFGARELRNRRIGTPKGSAAKVDMSKKRHGNERISPSEAKTKRQRRDPLPTQLSLGAIKKTMNLPTQKDFLDMPNELLKNPKSIRRYLPNAQTNIFTDRTSLLAGRAKCNLLYQLPNEEKLEVTGEGNNQHDAERTAYLHLISKLFDSGFLDTIWARIEHIDRNVEVKEQGAKLDVYNYAARYGAIPTFTVAVVPSTTKRHRPLVEVTIEMLEHNIRVSSKAKTAVGAEILAGIKFKRKAEEYHASNGTTELFIKDSTALCVNNARHFFEFYKNIDPQAKIMIPVVSRAANLKTCRLFLNNQVCGPEVKFYGKDATGEDMAYLVAALTLVKDQPTLLPRFLEALRAGNGQILKAAPSIDLELSPASIRGMTETLYEAWQAGLKDKVSGLETEERDDEQIRLSKRVLSADAAEKRSRFLLEKLQNFDSDAKQAARRKGRDSLPMSQYASNLLDMVENNIFSIVIGATGSGKTTQVPQILLDKAIREGEGGASNIICTQPRRIAATSVAKRVAYERPDGLHRTVGYHVKQDSNIPISGGSITYCTTGILLKQLQHNPNAALDNISHLILDEVHERDLVLDFLLITLKKVLAARLADGRRIPRVVLMSATIDPNLFASYFENFDQGSGEANCPTLNVPGRTFPVKEFYLDSILKRLEKDHPKGSFQSMEKDKSTIRYLESEKVFAEQSRATSSPEGLEKQDNVIIDWKTKTIVSKDGRTITSTEQEQEDALVPIGLVASTIAHIASSSKDGAILVFLPGLDEIVAVEKLLLEEKPLGIQFGHASKCKIYKLHSTISEQQQVFEPVPEGCRKIILGTNIAETSITIPEVKYVVDTGKLREKQYDQARRITKLQCTWISKSNSRQRAGRAGRVQDGNYYALFSKARSDRLRAIGFPELLRSDLQETCLAIKAQAFETPIGPFLADAIEPPAPAAVELAVRELIKLEALTVDEEMTSLGRVLASLPVHPSLGKMIILGTIYRCLDPMIILGAASADRSLFMNPLDAREKAKKAKASFVHGSDSDHIAFLNAFNELRFLQDSEGTTAMKQYAHTKFLGIKNFYNIRNTAEQIEDVLIATGLIPGKEDEQQSGYGGKAYNEHSNKLEMVKALIVAGMHPNIAVSTGKARFRTSNEKLSFIHPSSVLAEKFDYKRNGGDAERSRPILTTYSTLAKSNDGMTSFLRDVTLVHPLMAILFGSKPYTSKSSGHIIEMDDWLRFYVNGRAFKTVKTILEFKDAMDRMHTEAFRALNNKVPLVDNKIGGIFAQAIQDILAMENDSERDKARATASASPSRMTGAFDDLLFSSRR